jgi:hypothetical protein
MDWIHLALDRDQWRALLNTEWTFWFHKMLGISWVAERLAASQEGPSSMELVSWTDARARTHTHIYIYIRIHTTGVKLMMWHGMVWYDGCDENISEGSRTRRARIVSYTTGTVEFFLLRYSDQSVMLTDHPASSNAEAKSTMSVSSSPPYVFVMWVLGTGAILLLLWLLRRRRVSRKPHNTKSGTVDEKMKVLML